MMDKGEFWGQPFGNSPAMIHECINGSSTLNQGSIQEPKKVFNTIKEWLFPENDGSPLPTEMYMHKYYFH